MGKLGWLDWAMTDLLVQWILLFLFTVAVVVLIRLSVIWGVLCLFLRLRRLICRWFCGLDYDSLWWDVVVVNA